jgi:hypothetical protein
MPTIAQLLQAANVLLGVVAVSWLLMRTTMRWHHYPAEHRLVQLSQLAVLFALVQASGEQIIREVPFSVKDISVSLATVLTLFALHATKHVIFVYRKDETHKR